MLMIFLGLLENLLYFVVIFNRNFCLFFSHILWHFTVTWTKYVTFSGLGRFRKYI